MTTAPPRIARLLAVWTACSITAPLLAQTADYGGAGQLETGWSIVRSDLVITLEPKGKQLAVEGTLELVLDGKDESSGPSIGINARSPLMAWRELSCADAEVERGLAHPSRESVRLARVRFAEPKKRGAHIDVRFRCELEKNGRQLVVSPSIAMASWVEAWYPIAEPMPGTSLGGATRAAGTTKFDMPADWSAVTNGRRVSREERDGRAVEVWRTERALSRSFVAAPFERTVEESDSLTASLYLLSDRAKDPRAHVRALEQAIRAMEQRWGDYPFRSFSIAEVPTRFGAFGASSEQGFILVKPYFLEVEGGNLPLFAHEAAHAWWGNTVGSHGAGSLLCTESLAQYGAVLTIELLEGKAAATEFLRFSRTGYIANQSGRGYFELLRDGRDMPLATLTSGREPDHTLSDAKGHWIYHMLRRRIGDEVFFATTRQIIRDFDGKTMALDDLRERFEQAAPTAGLSRFFAQWLDRPGAPVLSARCVASDDGPRLEIQQHQAGEPFALDLDVELRLRDGGALRRSIALEDRTQTFDVQLDDGIAADSIAEVVLDPEHALLIWHPDYGPAPAGTIDDDPALAAEVRAIYVGEYAVEGRPLTVRVVERGDRLSIVVGDEEPQKLIPAGSHRFRCDNGRIEFEVGDSRSDALRFFRDGGGSVRAIRRKT